jgi:hypothetical protein
MLVQTSSKGQRSGCLSHHRVPGDESTYAGELPHLFNVFSACLRVARPADMTKIPFHN